MDQQTKQILTILDDAEVDGFQERAAKILKLDKAKIKQVAESLLKEGFVAVIELGDKRIYSHTLKVKKEMLDEGLHYRWGSKPLQAYNFKQD